MEKNCTKCKYITPLAGVDYGFCNHKDHLGRVATENTTCSEYEFKDKVDKAINKDLEKIFEAQPLVLSVDRWQPYLGACPHCGSANIEADYSMVLTSMPPQYNCRCKDCKGTFFTGQIKQENQTVNPAFPLGPQTPFNPPYTPTQPENPNYDYGYGNYGWICPKCGKVNAPHRDFCDCSGGGYYPNIVYCGGSGNNPNPAPTITVSNNTVKEK